MEFRTVILAVYVFSNFFVCLLVMNDSLKSLWFLGDSYWHKIWFFKSWMWMNSISYLVRFAGCVYYQARRLLWWKKPGWTLIKPDRDPQSANIERLFR